MSALSMIALSLLAAVAFGLVLGAILEWLAVRTVRRIDQARGHYTWPDAKRRER